MKKSWDSNRFLIEKFIGELVRLTSDGEPVNLDRFYEISDRMGFSKSSTVLSNIFSFLKYKYNKLFVKTKDNFLVSIPKNQNIHDLSEQFISFTNEKLQSKKSGDGIKVKISNPLTLGSEVYYMKDNLIHFGQVIGLRLDPSGSIDVELSNGYTLSDSQVYGTKNDLLIKLSAMVINDKIKQ
jgi:hypothetical protein